MNLRRSSSKFQVISNCYKRLYSLVVMTTRLRKRLNRRRKETRTVHLEIIISWDWLNRIGYFSGYELVERLKVCMSDKERIRFVERLVLSSVFCTQSVRV